MSVVIIGGNERMVTQYENICKEHGCKAKVFCKGKRFLKKEDRLPGFADFVHQHSFPQNGHQRDAGSEEKSDSGSTCTYQQCDSTSRGSGRALCSIRIKQLSVNGGSGAPAGHVFSD